MAGGQGRNREQIRVVIGAREPLFRLGVRTACEAAGLAIGAELIDVATPLLTDAIGPSVAVIEPELLEPEPAAAMGIASLRHRVLLVDRAGLDRPRFLRAGASGFVDRMVNADGLRQAIEAAAAGELVLPAAPAAPPPPLPGREGRWSPTYVGPVLTRRETDVLRLMAAGRSTSQCAVELHLSSTTVKTHLRSVATKLGTTSRTAAAAKATALGLLDES
ncbi:MAG: Two-component transcriptional response regulator, LuxR family [uncultured Solirubrobacteraceae bacterium]|uniref:Two-component transcriptional response regulator, LuxR family n=1 Tax=uncultured Solirubrobacteraceae bacterium TaxID=1162706 RepID=A0A6J4TN03_9ACTN|nr:MAG: Two-component transcriptional response regulator, LuxR family [uncultured Solirubrobacteraceae bacterium]